MRYLDTLYTLYERTPQPLKTLIKACGGARVFQAVERIQHPTKREFTVGDTTAEFVVSDRNEEEFIRKGISSEREILQDAIDEIRETDVLFDIGAHVGMYTAFLGNSTPGGKAVAFEPNPESYVTLCENVEANGLDAATYEVALSNENGYEPLDTSGEKKSRLKSDGDLRIKTEICDQFIQQEGLGRPSVIKVDVEGEELNVLRGLETTLAHEACRVIYCEVHPHTTYERGLSDEQIVMLHGILEQKGFEITILSGDKGAKGGIYILRGKKSA